MGFLQMLHLILSLAPILIELIKLAHQVIDEIKEAIDGLKAAPDVSENEKLASDMDRTEFIKKYGIGPIQADEGRFN